MGEQLGVEIGQQARLISDVTEDVESTSSKLKATQKKLEKLLHNQSGPHYCGAYCRRAQLRAS